MEPQPTNIDAIVALKPNAKWRYAVNSSGTTSLVWEDESETQPTDAEIATKLAELTTAWNAKLYQRNRVSLGTTTYPNISTQLDQLDHDMADGKLGVAATTGSWYVGITSVKTANPKP